MPADRSRARAALLALTLVWGSTFVVLQSTLVSLSPFVLISLRFAIAAATLVLTGAARLDRAIQALRPAFLLSLLMFIGFALQTNGLATTTPARSAFLTGLSVLLVPPLELVFFRRLPRPSLLAAVALAAAGVVVLFRPIAASWQRGDTLTLGATVVFAGYVIELGRRSRQVDAATLVLAQSLLIAVFAAVLAPLVEEPRLDLGRGAILAMLYLSVVCTALTFFLMTWAQARVEPVEAGVIYALEPVFAAAFSVAAGHEPFAAKMVTGGALIVLAMLVSGAGKDG